MRSHPTTSHLGWLLGPAVAVWASITSLSAAPAADVDVAQLPPAATQSIDYTRDILPIFEKACFRCHGPNRPRSGLRLDTKASALQGGDGGVDVVPGDSAHSPLIHYVSRVVEDMEMPPEGKGEPLSKEEVGLLRAWIDQGANYAVQAVPSRETLEVVPGGGFVFVDGDTGRFQEHHWRREGAQGGLERFRLEEQLSPRSRFTVEGHALRDDVGVRLDVRRDDLGFLRAGYQRWSRYYDDTGGFYPGLPELDSGRGLRLNLEKAWVEAGYDVPGRPRWVVGYDLEHKDGRKSLLEWLPVIAGGQIRRIGPNSKELEETRHIIHFDASNNIGGLFLEDNFRYEFYHLNTERDGSTPFVSPASPGTPVTIGEGEDHHNLANTLRAEKQVKEWLFLTGGYLFSRTDGDASFDLEVVGPFPGVFSSGKGLVLKQWAHVMNANARLGPWQGLTFTAGLQNEWSHQEGAGSILLDDDGLVPGLDPITLVPTTLDANQSSFQLEEHFGLRYTQIPRTVLFGEARLRQQTIGQFEEQTDGPASATFLRDTDVDRERADLRAGFQFSPWSRVSLTGEYRRRYSNNDYDHRRDERPFTGGLGYSAFILAQDLTTDEVEGRLVLRPLTWLKTTLTYRWIGTEHETRTDAAPGTTLLSGNSDIHVASAGVAVNPWRRVTFSGTFSYTQSRSVTLSDPQGATVPFKGNVYSVLGHVSLTLNPRTFLTSTYSFSRGDYEQDNFATGLPVGLTYDQHTLSAGISRTLSERVRVALRYAYFRYQEPSSAGQNDYGAHGIFATLAMNWK